MLTLEASYRSWGICVGKASVRCPSAGGQTVPFRAEMSLDEALSALKERYSRLAETDSVFAAHAEIADDPMLRESIENAVSDGLSLYEAVGRAGNELEALFDQIDDEYFRARKDDVRDVVRQLKKALAGEEGKESRDRISEQMPADGKIILVADEFLPSDIPAMDFSKIVGLVSETGSRTGHVSIIARSKGIPVLTGIKDCTALIHQGDIVILDGENGRVIVGPDENVLAEAERRIKGGEADSVRLLKLYRDAGVKVYANAGCTEDVRRAINAGAEGIGLYRSEFLFMDRTDGFPDEETQAAAYREAAEICGGLPLTIRTLDIGGDKALPYCRMKKEENPFLGRRAIRLSLADPGIFKVQLRAILRASAFGNVRVMFPMVCTLSELSSAKNFLEQCKNELRREGTAFDEHIPVGMMVETPAAALKAERFAGAVDFFSIGTNDLTQYVMAADRGNADVAGLYDCRDEAVLYCINKTLKAAAKAGIEAEVCGEMASDVACAAELISLGLKAASVASL
jgi:phosphoenolpyruvate-protein phosphotransferase (PTS system enzyme I)